MMNRCSSRSSPPGSRLITAPNGPRPQNRNNDTAVKPSTPRAWSSRKKRQRHTSVPMATRTDSTGQRPWSNSSPSNSHDITFLAPYESDQNVPTLYWLRASSSRSRRAEPEPRRPRARPDPDDGGVRRVPERLLGCDHHPNSQGEDREVGGEEVAGERAPRNRAASA